MSNLSEKQTTMKKAFALAEEAFKAQGIEVLTIGTVPELDSVRIQFLNNDLTTFLYTSDTGIVDLDKFKDSVTTLAKMYAKMSA